jgi:hypothetical protein
MRLAAKRRLSLQPDALVRGATGQVVTLSRAPLEAAFLRAYSPTLEPLWITALRSDALGVFVRGEQFWVFDRTGISVYDLEGTPIRRLDLPVPHGMRVGGAAPTVGGVVVAMEHDEKHPVTHPVLMRINESGVVQWISHLPMDDVALDMVEYRAADWQTINRREPVTTWHCSYFTGGTVVSSSGAVLAVFRDMPRSGIGMAYVVSVDDGAFRYSTEMGPIQEVAALDGGEFLAGYEGYGAFSTYRYGADGTIVDRWRSHGHYVVRDEDIRVVELRGDGGAMHLTRLKPNGTIARGARLDGYYTSRPCTSPDGLLLFFRRGLVYAVRNLSIAERLPVFDRDENVFATEMEIGPGCVYVGFTVHHPPRDPSRRLEFESYLVRVDWWPE